MINVMNVGTSQPVVLEAGYFVSVIEEFCMILFVIMSAWLVFLAIAHYFRAFTWRSGMKSFYKGLTGINNGTLFREYVQDHFSPEKHPGRNPLVDFFTRLLLIFQNYRENKNPSQYLTDVHQLRAQAREVFSHNNTRTFSLQLAAAVFIFIVLLGEWIFHYRSVSLLLLYAVGLFTLFSLGLYIRKERQGHRAQKEIEKLESIYTRYFAMGNPSA